MVSCENKNSKTFESATKLRFIVELATIFKKETLQVICSTNMELPQNVIKFFNIGA